MNIVVGDSGAMLFGSPAFAIPLEENKRTGKTNSVFICMKNGYCRLQNFQVVCLQNFF